MTVMEKLSPVGGHRQIVCGQTAGSLVLAVVGLLLTISAHSSSGLPISHPPQSVEAQPSSLDNLDLRVVDYRLPEGEEPLLGDDLVLEFKSENLSGIVRLSRIDELAVNSKDARYANKKNKHKKKDDDVKKYDERGAMYFAVSVVSLYGLSIGVLVAFSLRRDWDEDEVKNFQRSWVKIDHQMEKQEKQRAKRLMAKAIIAIHQPRKNSVATVTSQAVYMALAPVSFNGSSNQGGERRSSRETTIWNDLPPPMGTISEGAGANANKAHPPGVLLPAGNSPSQENPVVSNLSLDEGPLKAPLASTSGECRDWDLDQCEANEEVTMSLVKPGHLDTQLEQMDRMLEEGQLEGDFSLDLPDGDFALEEVSCRGNKGDMSWDGENSLVSCGRHGGSLEEADGMVTISPDGINLYHEANLHPEPMRAFLGVLSPSLPFMDDELGPNWPESQVWELSPSEEN